MSSTGQLTMDIECPNCSQKGKTDKSKIPVDGINVTCKACQTVFKIYIDSHDAVANDLKVIDLGDNQEVIVEANTCPTCKYTDTVNKFKSCPKCGLIIEKCHKYRNGKAIETFDGMITCRRCDAKVSMNALSCPTCREPSEQYINSKYSIYFNSTVLVCISVIVLLLIILTQLNTCSKPSNPSTEGSQNKVDSSTTAPTSTTDATTSFAPAIPVTPQHPQNIDTPKSIKIDPSRQVPATQPIPKPTTSPHPLLPPLSDRLSPTVMAPGGIEIKRDFSIDDIQFSEFDVYWYSNGGRIFPKVDFKIQNVSPYAIGHINSRTVLSYNDQIISEFNSPTVSTLSPGATTYLYESSNRYGNYTDVKDKTLAVKFYVKYNDTELLAKTTTLPWDKIYQTINGVLVAK